MFYLSRAEQLALVLLLGLLLAGSGFAIYERGVSAGRAAKDEPVFVDAPRAALPGGAVTMPRPTSGSPPDARITAQTDPGPASSPGAAADSAASSHAGTKPSPSITPLRTATGQMGGELALPMNRARLDLVISVACSKQRCVGMADTDLDACTEHRTADHGVHLS